MRGSVMALLPALALFSAALPAAARTSCDTYGRCFDFAGPSDRLGGGEADRLWRRIDAAKGAAEGAAPVGASAVADGSIAAPAGSAVPGDPLALATGTAGDPLDDLLSDD